jgi:hypothetical protein
MLQITQRYLLSWINKCQRFSGDVEGQHYVARMMQKSLYIAPQIEAKKPETGRCLK